MERSFFQLVAASPLTLSTSGDAPTGSQSLPFATTTDVVIGQQVTASGTAIGAGAIATGDTATTVSLSAATAVDIPGATNIDFGAYPAPALTDIDTLKDEIGIPPDDDANDTKLTRYLNIASAMALDYCRLPMPSGGTVRTPFQLQTYYEKFRGTPFVDSASLVNNPLMLILRRRPIVQVVKVLIDEDIAGTGPLVEGQDFELDYSTGFLYRLWNDLRMRWFFRILEVTYAAGYPAIPEPIQQAAIGLVKMMWFGRDRDPMLREIDQPQKGRRTYWVGTMPGQVGALPPDVEALLDPYRESYF